jgi:hypothetical protein
MCASRGNASEFSGTYVPRGSFQLSCVFGRVGVGEEVSCCKTLISRDILCDWGNVSGVSYGCCFTVHVLGLSEV